MAVNVFSQAGVGLACLVTLTSLAACRQNCGRGVARTLSGVVAGRSTDSEQQRGLPRVGRYSGAVDGVPIEFWVLDTGRVRLRIDRNPGGPEFVDWWEGDLIDGADAFRLDRGDGGAHSLRSAPDRVSIWLDEEFRVSRGLVELRRTGLR